MACRRTWLRKWLSNKRTDLASVPPLPSDDYWLYIIWLQCLRGPLQWIECLANRGGMSDQLGCRLNEITGWKQNYGVQQVSPKNVITTHHRQSRFVRDNPVL